MKLYNLVFRMIFLIVRYIKKMATDGGRGVVDGRHSNDCKRNIGPRLKSQPGYNLFSLIFVQIHINKFIQLLYNLVLRMVFLIVRYINEMATDGGRGVVDGRHSNDCKRDIGPRLKSQPGYNLFSLIFVQIHTNEFIQLLYKLYSTNSYTVWFLYQLIQCLYELYSTNSYKV